MNGVGGKTHGDLLAIARVSPTRSQSILLRFLPYEDSRFLLRHSSRSQGVLCSEPGLISCLRTTDLALVAVEFMLGASRFCWPSCFFRSYMSPNSESNKRGSKFPHRGIARAAHPLPRASNWKEPGT